MASRENTGKRGKSPQKEMEEKMRGRENTESQVKTGTFPLKDEDTAMCFQWFLIYPKQYVFISFCKYVFFFFCREKPPVKEARRPPAPPSWLQRDLKVRFIDKAFKGGRYYNSKVLTRLVSLAVSGIMKCRWCNQVICFCFKLLNQQGFLASHLFCINLIGWSVFVFY